MILLNIVWNTNGVSDTTPGQLCTDACVFLYVGVYACVYVCVYMYMYV